MKKKKLTKKHIIDFLYTYNQSYSKSKIEEIINYFIIFFQGALKKGYTLEIRGLGTFSVKTIPAREQAWNINNKKGLLNNNNCEQRKYFPECRSVRFKPSITLRELLNEKESEDVNKEEIKDVFIPTTTDLNLLENATDEERKEALNLILDEAKTKNSMFD